MTTFGEGQPNMQQRTSLLQEALQKNNNNNIKEDTKKDHIIKKINQTK